MIVHRILDAFFKGLDTVDSVRDHIDHILGRESKPDPWTIDWDKKSTDENAKFESDIKDTPKSEANDSAPVHANPKTETTPKPEATKLKAQEVDAKKTTAKKASQKTASATTKRPRKAAAKNPKGSTKRKGSVDRSGKDLSTPRALTVTAFLEAEKARKVTESDAVTGKKVLARVVWALHGSHQSGEASGMTTKDISAVLSGYADIEVFTTNIGRACREHTHLIQESSPDGRSKRYILTAAGTAEGTRLFSDS